MEVEEIFSNFIIERFPPDKRSTSGVIYSDLGTKIISVLKDSSNADKNFRFWVKKRGFQLLSLPSVGAQDVLVVPNKQVQQIEDTSILRDVKKVIFVEDFFQILSLVHEKELLHAGYKKTFDKVHGMYYGIPRSVVEKFVSLCPTCQLRKPQIVTAPLKPIIAKGFLSRLQIDLIDMRHLPDGNKKWILHGIDHWSKFNFAFGIPSKQAVDVAFILNAHVFPYFGVPRILHSDNGREFVNRVIQLLLKSWHSDIQLVSGRPRHPQSQGLVERAHYTLERKLSAKIAKCQQKQPPWDSWLPHIVYAMNTQVHESTGTSPYEAVFGQKPRSVVFPTQERIAVILEEELEMDGVYVEEVTMDDYFAEEDEQIEEEREFEALVEKNAIEAVDEQEDAIEAVDEQEEAIEAVDEQEEAIEEVDEQEEAIEAVDEQEETVEEVVGALDEKKDMEFAREEGEIDDELEVRENALTTSEKHRKIRIQADRKYLKSAKRMAERYNRKKSAHKFSVGDKVSLRIPRIDRASSDLPRLPCLVVQVNGKALCTYRLRCKYGILSTSYPAGELERFDGPIEFSLERWEEEQRLSLREAARKQSPWNAFVSNACKCTTGCETRKCRCVKQGISCSSHCHAAKPCSNKNYSQSTVGATTSKKTKKKTLPQSKSQHMPDEYNTHKKQNSKRPLALTDSDEMQQPKRKSAVNTGDIMNIQSIKANKSCWGKPLTKEQKTRVLTNACNTNTINITPNSGCVVYPSDLRRLIGGRCLTGEIIDSLLAIFGTKSALESKGNHYVYVLDNHFLTVAKRDCSVQFWIDDKEMDRCTLLLTAANVNNSHWCLAGIDKLNQEVFYFDPLGGDGCTRHINLLKRVVNQYILKQPPGDSNVPVLPGWKITLARDVQGYALQKNGIDCGVFTVMYGLYKIHSSVQGHDFCTDDMAHIRWWLGLVVTDCASALALSEQKVLRKKEDSEKTEVTFRDDDSTAKVEDKCVMQWPSAEEVIAMIGTHKEHLENIVTGKRESHRRTIALKGKWKERQRLKDSSFGKTLDIFSSDELCRITECLNDVSVQSGLQVSETEHFSLTLDVLYSEIVILSLLVKNPKISKEEAASCYFGL